MYDLDSMLQEVVAQARAVGIPVSRKILPHVVVNGRAKTRFGCCKKRDGVYTIEVSDRLLSADERARRQTLAHEILHTCRGCSNHGERWKAYAEAMNAAYGYGISRLCSGESMGLEPDRSYKYAVRCVKCGKSYERLKRSSIILHPERYRCICGGALERVR